MKTEHNKLVRDFIPDIINSKGLKANTHQVRDRKEMIKQFW